MVADRTAARKLVDAHIDSMTTHLSEAERRLAAENQRTATQAVYALAEAEHRISSKVGAVVKATRKELRRVTMASRRELLTALVCLLLIQVGTIAFLVLR